MIDLGYTPHKHQAELHRRLGRFGVVVAHRRFGKTVFAVMELVDRALEDGTGSGRFGYVAPYLKQAKEVSWDYLKRYSRPVTGARINESELSITYPNGARIRLYGADNADAMRGTYFDFVVIDEVADMKNEVWGEIIRPALADRKGGALFIGTPKGINLLAELYHADGDGWTRAMYRADETGLIEAGELALARSAMSESQFSQEFLCDFTASSDNVLIPITLASEAARKVITPDQIAHATTILGVDVARYGSDRSAIFRRKGLQAFTPRVMQGLNNMEVAAIVMQEMQEHQPDAVFIDAGRGEGVIDRLRQLGANVVEVNFGGKPDNPRYRNRRSEMWDSLARWLQGGGSIPPMAELKTELSAPTYSLANAANVFELEPKEAIKERIGRSVDLADALALTFAYPVMPRLVGTKPKPADPDWWQ